MQKFTQRLPKDDLKKFAKEVGKRLVASDFKNNRVEDPTKISEKQEKKVKKYVKEYFEKAVEKKKAIDKRKKEKAADASSSDYKVTVVNGNGADKPDAPGGILDELKPEGELLKEESDVEISDDDDKHPFPETPSFTEFLDLKRKREQSELDTPSGDIDPKRLKEDEESPHDISPPPPPPPPPADSMPPDVSMDDSYVDLEETKGETEEEKELRKQEEDLMRENEEAMIMEMDGTLKAEEKLHSHSGVEEMHSNGLPKREGILSH